MGHVGVTNKWGENGKNDQCNVIGCISQSDYFQRLKPTNDTHYDILVAQIRKSLSIDNFSEWWWQPNIVGQPRHMRTTLRREEERRVTSWNDHSTASDPRKIISELFGWSEFSLIFYKSEMEAVLSCHLLCFDPQWIKINFWPGTTVTTEFEY